MIITNNNRNLFNDIGIFAHKKLLMNALGTFLLEKFWQNTEIKYNAF